MKTSRMGRRGTFEQKARRVANLRNPVDRRETAMSIARLAREQRWSMQALGIWADEFGRKQGRPDLARFWHAVQTCLRWLLSKEANQ